MPEWEAETPLSTARLADLIGAEGKRGVAPDSDVLAEGDVNELKDAAGDEAIEED